jgi:amino acid adenylation domain-containing protein
MEPLVRFFANTLVLRTDIGGDPAFRELVRRCGGTVLGALAHQDVPFGRLVDELRPDRDPARNPLFQISFTLQAGNTAGGQFELPGLTAEPIDTARSNSRFDLGLTVIAHDNGPFEAQLEYSTELFGRGRVVGLVEHFRRVLEEVVADPGVRVGRLDVLTEGERGRLVGEWNPVPHRFATEGSLLHRLVPADERPAVRFAGRTLTYAELGVRSDRLAGVLAARGVGPDVVVGVLLERGFDLPVAQLGVLKAGGAWVPLDPAHPVGRLAFQISDTGAPLVVTTSGLADRLPAGVPRICLDDPGSLDGPGTAPEVGTRPDDAAYVIYTSGSTGTPKGVVVSHRSVVNFVSAIGELFSIGRQDRVLQFANPSFDVSIFDFYAALCRGATVVAAPRSVLLEPDALTGLMASEGVTIADIPPAVLGLLSPGDLPGLRVLWVGLEAFPADLVNAWNRGGREFHNGYGPTEATVACVDYRCPPGVMAGKPPIGRPMANHRVYVLNDDMRLVPPGVPGELFVAGAGLARGYLNQPALTAERFLPDPFGPAPGGRMYRTGDVVRWREDGLLEFLGRADRQVKIRGLRIELTEIEHVLSAQPGIRQAAVTVHDQAQLVGYVVSDAQPDEALLREALARQLPLHMVPTTIMFLDTLPLTTSGKLDHSKLPPPAAPQDRPRVPPRTHAEAAIARIWASILNLPAGELSTQDSFFALGGNSLRAVQLLSRINDEFAVELDLRTLFTNPALGPLAAVLDGLRAELEAEVANLPEEEIDRLLAAGGTP